MERITIKLAFAAASFATLCAFSNTSNAVYLEINIESEIDLQDGTYLTKEIGEHGRFALISHDHGRFESKDIMTAECNEGYLASKLPAKFANVKSRLKPNDYILTMCREH